MFFSKCQYHLITPNLKPFCGTCCSWSEDILPQGPCQPLWPSQLLSFPRLMPSLSELRFSLHRASCIEQLLLLCTAPRTPCFRTFMSQSHIFLNTPSMVCLPSRAQGHLLSLYHTNNFMVTFEIIEYYLSPLPFMCELPENRTIILSLV